MVGDTKASAVDGGEGGEWVHTKININKNKKK